VGYIFTCACSEVLADCNGPSCFCRNGSLCACVTSGILIVSFGINFLRHREGKHCLPPHAQLCHVSRGDVVLSSVYDGRPRQESAEGSSEALRGEGRRPPQVEGGNQGAPHHTSLSRGSRLRNGGIKRRGGLLHSQLRGHGHGHSHVSFQPPRQGHRRNTRQEQEQAPSSFFLRRGGVLFLKRQDFGGG